MDEHRSFTQLDGRIDSKHRHLLAIVLDRHQLPANPRTLGRLARDQIPGRGQESDSRPRPFCRTDHLSVVAHQSHNPLH